jgi:hypothetical protein
MVDVNDLIALQKGTTELLLTEALKRLNTPYTRELISKKDVVISTTISASINGVFVSVSKMYYFDGTTGKNYQVADVHNKQFGT